MSRALALLAVTLAGCAFEGTFETPTPGLHRMLEQPRADAYESTSAFDDGLVMRHPPAGTVVYGEAPNEDPPPLDLGLVRSGRESFETFCAACHGMAADGDTALREDMVLRAPPSLLTAKVRGRSDRELFRIAGRGYGLMPGYDEALDPDDRWAVVAYLRALQLSQRAPVDQLPARLRAEVMR